MDGTRTVTHTPGPWIVTEQDSEGHAVIEAENGTTAVAYTAGWYRNDGRNDGPANARLIAAAPDLLKAAQDVLEDAVSDMPATVRITKGSLDALRAAIAKATGGE